MNTHGKKPVGSIEPQVPKAAKASATPSVLAGDDDPDTSEDVENTVLGNIGHAPEGPLADTDHSVVPLTTTMGGLTTRGEYATDPATGGGRYMGHGAGTFGMDPVDPPSEDHDAIDPKI